MKFLVWTLLSLAFGNFAYAIECQGKNGDVFDCTYGCCGTAKEGSCCTSTDLVIIVVPVLFAAAMLIIGGLVLMKCLKRNNAVKSAESIGSDATFTNVAPINTKES